MTAKRESDELDAALWERLEQQKRAQHERTQLPAHGYVTERGQRFMRGARKPALAGIAASLLLIGTNAHMIGDSGMFAPKSLAVGIALLPAALAMFLWPGRVDLPMFTVRRIPLSEILGGLEPHERWLWLAVRVNEFETSGNGVY